MINVAPAYEPRYYERAAQRHMAAGLLSEVLDNVDRAGIDLSPTELVLVSASYESSLPGR